MHTAPNTGLLQLTDKLVASDAEKIQDQLNDVKVPGMLHMGRCLRTNNFRQISKALVIEIRVPLACLPESIALFELCQTQCRSNVSEIVFEPGREDFVIP